MGEEERVRKKERKNLVLYSWFGAVLPVWKLRKLCKFLFCKEVSKYIMYVMYIITKILNVFV